MAIDINEFVPEATTTASNQDHLAVTVRFVGSALPRMGYSIAHTRDDATDRSAALEIDVLPAIPLGPVGLALQPMALTVEEAEEMREFLAHGRAYPTIPTRRVPQGDRSLLKKRRH